jgi:hypothetical protein
LAALLTKLSVTGTTSPSALYAENNRGSKYKFSSNKVLSQ